MLQVAALLQSVQLGINCQVFHKIFSRVVCVRILNSQKHHIAIFVCSAGDTSVPGLGGLGGNSIIPLITNLQASLKAPSGSPQPSSSSFQPSQDLQTLTQSTSFNDHTVPIENVGSAQTNSVNENNSSLQVRKEVTQTRIINYVFLVIDFLKLYTILEAVNR